MAAPAAGSPSTSRRPDAPREFAAAVELYVPASARAPAGLRKGGAHKKRSESKLDFLRPLAGAAEEGQRKLKEKSSWLSLSKSSPAAGLWRSATCKLTEDGQGCLVMTVYLEETVLYHTVYVHLLRHTDVRAADRSLFGRKDILGVHSTPYVSPRSAPEALYLAFPTPEALHTWTALLRAYATPEVYGRQLAAAAAAALSPLPPLSPLSPLSPAPPPMSPSLAHPYSAPYPPAHQHNRTAHDGGLYRMWRQLELAVVAGRHFGVRAGASGASWAAGFGAGLSGPADDDAHGHGHGHGQHGYAHMFGAPDDAGDGGLACEVRVDGAVLGRTAARRAGAGVGGAGAPDWHESFAFPDLPPFGNLVVLVCRERRTGAKGGGGGGGGAGGAAAAGGKVVVGSVVIALGAMRRGVEVDGWYPVLSTDEESSGSTGTSPSSPVGIATGPVTQVGEIRLKFTVTEEIVLPQSAYASLLETLNSRNFLDWLADFEQKLSLKTLRPHLLAIAAARNVLVEQIFEQADREVDGGPNSHNTLFRGNTVLTKTMELCMATFGAGFLEASVGAPLRRLCAERVAIEIDPVRSGKSVRDIERNVDLLVQWCKEFWRQIYTTRGECPHEMRQLFHHIRVVVERKYQSKGEENRELPWQSVSSFCFLRFIVPAILNPHMFGLASGLPEPAVQRSLTLIGKVIQSLANLNPTVQREEFMRPLKVFLNDSVDSMIDYILEVSNPGPTQPYGGAYPSPTADGADRQAVTVAIRQRGSTLPTLFREAIPRLPYLFDIPKHLAVLTSAVLLHARGRTPDDPLAPLDQLINKCRDVEGRALRRVRRLANANRPAPPAERERTRRATLTTEREALASPLSPTSPRTPRRAGTGAVTIPSMQSSPASTTSPRHRKMSPASAAPSHSSSSRSRRRARPSSAPSASDTSLPLASVQTRERAGPADENNPTPASASPLSGRGAWSRSSQPELQIPRQILPPPTPTYGLTPSVVEGAEGNLYRVYSVDPAKVRDDDAAKKKKGILRILTRR